MIRKEKDMHIRVSNEALKLIKDKAQRCGISQSKLVRIAVDIITKDDVLEYMLNKIGVEFKQC